VPGDFLCFDYILVADRENLRAAQAMAPPASRARLQLLLDFAPGQALREVPDPYYGGPADFERVVGLCEQAARGLIAQLQGH
jgi:protein-tyrosine phosphatase